MSGSIRPGNRVVAVTGAATGIGRALAERFAEMGDQLALAYFGDRNDLDELAAAHPKGADQVLLTDLDVRDVEACARFVRATEQRFGHIDVLVTSAGVAFWGPTHEFSWDRYRQLFDVNVTGTYACIRATLPGMLARGAGRIITISSEVALVGMQEAVAYCGTKGAVIAMTKSLAREYASRGVLINSVAPGPTRTPLLAQSPESNDPAVEAAVPIGRFGQPREIAGAVAMLAGEDGTFFVGQIISPNGGAAI